MKLPCMKAQDDCSGCIEMDVIDDPTIDACAQCGAKQGTVTELTADEISFEVNKTCGHKFCQNCIHDQFTNQGKRQFTCARCSSMGRQVMVKREKLSKKSLDSIEADKDNRIRAKVKEIFNRREEDFPTLEEYNNYEEEVEDIIYNLVHELKVDEMNEKITKYKKDNEELIVLNQGKSFEEQSELRQKVKRETEQNMLHKQNQMLTEQKERKQRAEKSRQLNEIALGERDKLTINSDAMDVDPSSLSKEEHERQQMQAMQHFSSHSALLREFDRPAPKVISAPKDPTVVSRMSASDKRDMYKAGGYNYTEFLRKSWLSAFSPDSMPRGWV